MSDVKNLQGIWTQYGLDRLAAWLAGGDPIVLTVGAVGNGGGSVPEVSPSQTDLVDEEWRGLLNGVRVNPKDPTEVLVELVIPNDVGPFWIREWGIYDDAGHLVAVGPHEEQRKPDISSGQTAEYLEIFRLPLSNAGAITLSIATQALATQSFVQEEIEKHNTLTLELGAHGFVMGQEGQILAVQNGKLTWTNRYELCEFYYFRHPVLKPGFLPAQGGLVEDAAELYPEAWAYLQTSEGRLLCKTEAEWQAMIKAIFATLSTGATIGWNGIGGAPFYAPNMATGALRLPDLRGMYIEASGFDSLGVGGLHGDGVRNIVGSVGYLFSYNQTYDITGPFYQKSTSTQPIGANSPIMTPIAGYDVSRMVPTANKVQPRAWGALACVYLGS